MLISAEADPFIGNIVNLEANPENFHLVIYLINTARKIWVVREWIPWDKKKEFFNQKLKELYDSSKYQEKI